MKNRIVFLAVIFITGHVLVKAQNQLPEDLKSKIPPRYTLISGSVVKSGEIVNASIGLETPGKYGCGKNKENYRKTDIGINIALNSVEFGKMMEQAVPFKTFWPTKETHHPNLNAPGNEFTEYSETVTFEMPGGQAAYYTWTRKCIQDANQAVRGVSLMSISGSHSRRITIGIDGDIDGDEAIAILKELHTIISQYNF